MTDPAVPEVPTCEVLGTSSLRFSVLLSALVRRQKGSPSSKGYTSRWGKLGIESSLMLLQILSWFFFCDLLSSTYFLKSSLPQISKSLRVIFLPFEFSHFGLDFSYLCLLSQFSRVPSLSSFLKFVVIIHLSQSSFPFLSLSCVSMPFYSLFSLFLCFSGLKEKVQING